MRTHTALENQQALALETGSEIRTGLDKEDAPVIDDRLMERVLERENLRRAFRQVKRNKGSAGIDGMSVDELTALVDQHGSSIHQPLLEGRYRPKPVNQVERPKPKGGAWKLGIPTVVDRLIQQALLQGLQPEWDGSFSPSSYGFRPGRSAHQAIRQSQEFINEGYNWTVDMDLEKFFDRVNHDKLRSLVKRRTGNKRVLKLINSSLKAGALCGDVGVPAPEGTPQGGPLSPLLAKELATYRRGWKTYFGLAEVASPLKDLAKWVRRKLRCYLWKQWGRSGYRQLRKRGIKRQLAWNTTKSAHGPWRLSGSPALR